MAKVSIDQFPEPLIGMHYIVEHKFRDTTNYRCNLCKTSCGADNHDVIGHVTGRQHRSNYISTHYISYLQVIESSPMSEHDVLLLEYSRIIEAAEGHQKIQVKSKNQSPKSEEGGLKKTIAGQESQSKGVQECTEVPSEKCSFPDSSIGCVLHNIALRSGARNAAELLHELTKSLVTNEEEAAKALEAANILTKSLLEYRLSSPK